MGSTPDYNETWAQGLSGSELATAALRIAEEHGAHEPAAGSLGQQRQSILIEVARRLHATGGYVQARDGFHGAREALAEAALAEVRRIIGKWVPAAEDFLIDGEYNEDHELRLAVKLIDGRDAEDYFEGTTFTDFENDVEEALGYLAVTDPATFETPQHFDLIEGSSK